MDFDKIVDLFRALNARGVRYVLVGGIAVNLHDVFDDPSIDEISADDLAGSYPTVRYVPPSSLSWWI